jgi:hypothetical protein
MTLGTVYRPALGNVVRALFSTGLKHSAALPTPSCDDCQLPATLKAEIPDARLQRLVRVHQCPNCAKVIWGDE